jgi:oxygen-independent coproporphyrinogen-3 oxidase
MGIQSFDDGILRWMNRRHSAAGAVEAFRILRRCGVRNISVDLIFGLSQLADDVWEDTIERALELAPEHLSAYQLSIEEGSALAKLVADGRYVEASDEQCRHQYDVLCQTLRQAGYHHYEISNFARPGFEAVHNNAYWSRVPYIGLGPGAHSLTGDIRSWNSQELPHRSTDGSPATYSRTSETLSPEDIRVERIMLSLRTDKGLEAAELYSLTDRAVINSLLSEGALEKQGGSIPVFDFGKAMNSGAHLIALRRTKIGDYDVKNAMDVMAFVDSIVHSAT